MDGGTTWNINIVSAVEKCKAMGFEENEITIDIIMNETPSIGQWKNRTAYDNHLRYNEIKEFYNHVGDIYEFKLAYD